jgi:hypothetical protein
VTIGSWRVVATQPQGRKLRLTVSGRSLLAGSATEAVVAMRLLCAVTVALLASSVGSSPVPHQEEPPSGESGLKGLPRQVDDLVLKVSRLHTQTGLLLK